MGSARPCSTGRLSMSSQARTEQQDQEFSSHLMDWPARRIGCELLPSVCRLLRRVVRLMAASVLARK